MKLGIVNYGGANLRSVQKAFEHVGHAAEIIDKPEQVDRAGKIVMPGVGAFADAANALRKSELAGPVLNHVKKGKPFFGICLGLQVLFEVGYEDGTHQGLGLFAGKCIRFDVDDAFGLKVPHMGWNQLNAKKPSPILRDLPAEASVYFVHSYHVVPADGSIIATTTDYGRPFVSSIWRDNVMATQFHPEKSQAVGLKILENFATL